MLWPYDYQTLEMHFIAIEERRCHLFGYPSFRLLVEYLMYGFVYS